MTKKRPLLTKAEAKEEAEWEGQRKLDWERKDYTRPLKEMLDRRREIQDDKNERQG